MDDEISYECLELSSDDMPVVVSMSSGTTDVEFNSGDRTVVVEVTSMLLSSGIIGKNISWLIPRVTDCANRMQKKKKKKKRSINFITF